MCVCGVCGVCVCVVCGVCVLCVCCVCVCVCVCCVCVLCVCVLCVCRVCVVCVCVCVLCVCVCVCVCVRYIKKEVFSSSIICYDMVCSSLSLEDHRRQAGDLITGFIQKIKFGHDFEQQLSFYVEVRANFTNLDQVLIFLIQVCP